MTRAELLAFLRTHRLAVVSTIHHGAPQAAVVGIGVADDLERRYAGRKLWPGQ
ncbi:hypothetical protein [Bradyrhizobium ivorense]|uniref:hypothetical protein n=1 Tax=Bradyrhizobium ivorense TaxID=2511166 RepID=UPI0010B64CBF|nr:hypothetical protein [Bradyrhizobium ivorense]VIO80174.1 hypothetical protein CI41S_71340 [Bradyrhizobium ivorense]